MEVQAYGGAGLQPRTPPAPAGSAVIPAGSISSPTGRRHLALKGVADKLGVSERSVHKIVSQPWFPAPVMLLGGERGWRRWIESEIDDALATRAPRAEVKPSEPEHLRRSRIDRMKAGAA